MAIGCKPMITKQEFAPKMYSEHPASILVLPPINKTTATDAKEYYITTLAEPLTNSGYYVFPMEVVNDVLKQEGLFDAETIPLSAFPKFKNYFGADAVLSVRLLKWDTQYLITAGSVKVKIACDLISTITCDTLWRYHETVEVNTSGSSGGAGGLAGLLVKAVATAIKTATTDYIPLAKDVNEKILFAMPYGKYHKDYGRDGTVVIEKKKAETE